MPASRRRPRHDFTVSSVADPDNSGSFIVTTFVDGTVQDVQSGKAVTDLISNLWVDFSGTGTITASVVEALSGGLDGTVSDTSYSSFLTALEPEKFDVVIYDGTSETVSAAMLAFIKRLREDDGRKVRAIMPGYAQANYEGVTSPLNGLVLSDGTTLTPEQSCWWLGGCSSGAGYNQDLTYAVHPQAVDVSPKYTSEQAAEHIKAGYLIYFEDEGSVRIYYDVNTLTTFTKDKAKVFSRNRPIRTLDYLSNKLYRIFADYHAGQTDMTSSGMNLFKKEVIDLMNVMQAARAIKNFSKDDVSVTAGEDGDAFIVTLAVQPVDASNKVYMTVSVR